MSPSLQHFFQSEQVMALLIAVLIFLVTIFLVVKRWIGFSITFLLLVFALAAGVVINNQNALKTYLEHPHIDYPVDKTSQNDFQKQMIQAVEGLKVEVQAEKENLSKVMGQVQEIFDHMEAQKQKLQDFIEETRDRFKTEHPSKVADADITSPTQ